MQRDTNKHPVASARRAVARVRPRGLPGIVARYRYAIALLIAAGLFLSGGVMRSRIDDRISFFINYHEIGHEKFMKETEMDGNSVCGIIRLLLYNSHEYFNEFADRLSSALLPTKAVEILADCKVSGSTNQV